MAYAERTGVSVSQTRHEIEDRLRKAGARRIVHVDEPLEAIVMFEMEGRTIKLEVPIPSDADEQKHRSLWRSLGLVMKAKLESIASKIVTAEQEWLAHIVLPNGRTMGEWALPQLEAAYDRGEMPPIRCAFRHRREGERERPSRRRGVRDALRRARPGDRRRSGLARPGLARLGRRDLARRRHCHARRGA